MSVAWRSTEGMSSERDKISESIDLARFSLSACTRKTGKEEAQDAAPDGRKSPVHLRFFASILFSFLLSLFVLFPPTGELDVRHT